MSVKCYNQIFKILLLNIILFQFTNATGPTPLLNKAARELPPIRSCRNQLNLINNHPDIPLELIEFSEQNNYSCSQKKLTYINSKEYNPNIVLKITLNILFIKNSDYSEIIANINTEIYHAKQAIKGHTIKHFASTVPSLSIIASCLKEAKGKYFKFINSWNVFDESTDDQEKQFDF